MSQYSIFHTSHCGSTLLASMLSKSIPTITEPSWSHRIHKQPGKINTINFLSSNLVDNTLVKYSSMYCYVAPLVDGKKIYLYRTLQSHLEKMLSNSSYLIHNSESTTEVLKGNLHKDLGWDYISIKDSEYIKAHALLWIDRYLHINDSKDLLLISSSDFLNDKQKTAKQVCNFFEIEYIPVDGQFDAKLSGLNHNDTPITLPSRKLFRYEYRKNKPTNTLFVSSVVSQIKKQYPYIPERMLFDL
jgi:hypothetical protein